jgi:hypothetical protein
MDPRKELLTAALWAAWSAAGRCRLQRQMLLRERRANTAGDTACQIQKHATVRTLALYHGLGAIHSEKERTEFAPIRAGNLNVIDGSKGRLPAQ